MKKKKNSHHITTTTITKIFFRHIYFRIKKEQTNSVVIKNIVNIKRNCPVFQFFVFFFFFLVGIFAWCFKCKVRWYRRLNFFSQSSQLNCRSPWIFLWPRKIRADLKLFWQSSHWNNITVMKNVDFSLYRQEKRQL